MSKTILLRLSDTDLARLDAHVESINGVRSKTIVRAIHEYLERREKPAHKPPRRRNANS